MTPDLEYVFFNTF